MSSGPLLAVADDDELPWDDLDSLLDAESPVKRTPTRKSDSVNRALAQLDRLWAEMECASARDVRPSPRMIRPTPADRMLRLRGRTSQRDPKDPAQKVDFSRRTDEMALWLGRWSRVERMHFLRVLAERGLDLHQKRSLYTITMPHLHRDTMYAARHSFPELDFRPVSDYFSRAARRRMSNKEAAAFHRLPSAYLWHERQLEALISPGRSLVEDHVDTEESAPILIRGRRRQKQNRSETSLLRFASSPVTATRRHLQEVEEVSKAASVQTDELITAFQNDWSPEERNRFLNFLVRKLSPPELYFLAGLLSVKTSRDIITLLPEELALRVFSFLGLRDLMNAGRVCSRWKQLASHDSLWRPLCTESATVEVAGIGDSAWRNVFYANHKLKRNWKNGRTRLVELRGHEAKVLCLAIHKNLLASGGQDHAIRVWCLLTWRQLRILDGHQKAIWSVQFYSDTLLISASSDETIKVWNVRSGECQRTILCHTGPVWCLCVHDTLMVTGAQDRTSVVWNLSRMRLTHRLQAHSGPVFCVAMDELEHRQEQKIYTGSSDRTVRIWSAENGRCLKTLWISPEDRDPVMSLAVHRGFMVCAYGSSVALYKEMVGSITGIGWECMQTWGEHYHRVESVQLQVKEPTRRHGLLVTGSSDGLVKLWDLDAPRSRMTFGHYEDSVHAVLLDSLRIVSTSADGSIKIRQFL